MSRRLSSFFKASRSDLLIKFASVDVDDVDDADDDDADLQ